MDIKEQERIFANQAAAIFYAIEMRNLSASAYSTFVSKMKEIQEMGMPSFEECISCNPLQEASIISLEKCLRFLIEFDKNAMQDDCGGYIVPPMNSEYTDLILVYGLNSGYPRIRRKESQNLNSLFTNAVFLRIDDFGQKMNIEVNICATQKRAVSINIYYLPFPRNENILKRVKGGAKGNKIRVPELDEEREEFKLFRDRLDDLSKTIMREKTHSIVFGPELEGSKFINEEFRKVVEDNPYILLAIAPSYHQSGKNRSLAIYQSHMADLEEPITKCNRAYLDDQIEGIDFDESDKFHIFFIPGFGKVLVCLCSDLFDERIHKLERRILPSIIIVQSFTRDYSSFRNEFEKLGPEYIPVLLGNSCSACSASGEKLPCIIYSTKNKVKSRNKEFMEIKEGVMCQKNCSEEKQCFFKWAVTHESRDSKGGYTEFWLAIKEERNNG